MLADRMTSEERMEALIEGKELDRVPVNPFIQSFAAKISGIPFKDFFADPDRLNHIMEMAETYRADGVIHYGLQFCQPYLMEAIPVEKALVSKNIPTLRIDTDYSMEDVGQLKTRVEAFIEMIKK